MAEVIGDECGEVVWIPGHIRDRDQRRRILLGSEWCADMTFMGAVKAARAYRFVWMQPIQDRFMECAEGAPDATAWTRIELPSGWDDWV